MTMVMFMSTVIVDGYCDDDDGDDGYWYDEGDDYRYVDGDGYYDACCCWLCGNVC